MSSDAWDKVVGVVCFVVWVYLIYLLASGGIA